MKYLLISNLSFAVFFLVYWLLFKRTTFFRVNRFYWLLALLFSALVPFLSFPLQEARVVLLPAATLPAVVVSPQDHPLITPYAPSIMYVYWAGVLLGAGMLVYAFTRILRSGYNGAVQHHQVSRYFSSEGSHAFSFFNCIQIGDRLDPETLDMVMVHEAVHKRQLHSFDVLLFSLARVFAWFNPLVHIAAREVQLNHEFLADRASLARFGTNYQYSLLSHALDTKLFPLTNSFFSKSLIKNRIFMMNKNSSGKWSLLKYAFIVPMIAGFVWFNSCSKQADIPGMEQKTGLTGESAQTNEDKVYTQSDAVDKLPGFPGGEDGLLTYFQTGFTYPDELKEAGIQGLCTVAFVVNEDGSLSNVEIAKSEHEMLNEPAITFVKDMPKWTPGELDGKNVKVKMYLPVKFSLN